MIIVEEVYLSVEESEKLTQILNEEGEKCNDPDFSLSDFVKRAISAYEITSEEVAPADEKAVVLEKNSKKSF